MSVINEKKLWSIIDEMSKDGSLSSYIDIDIKNQFYLEAVMFENVDIKEVDNFLKKYPKALSI